MLFLLKIYGHSNVYLVCGMLYHIPILPPNNYYSMNYFKIMIGLFMSFCSCVNSVDKSELSSMDYELFIGTAAETLAEAVKDGDTISIKKEILVNHVPVDMRSAEYGTSLLMIATYYNNIRSAKCLLELGANPNLYNDTTKSWGENSILIASRRMTPSPEMLKMLLSYGGDPNSQAKGVKYNNAREIVPMRDFALQVAAAYSIEKVKILVQAKADINKMDNNPNNSAVFSAIIHNQMDVLLYLLQNGADYTVKFKQGDYTTEKTIYKECDILDMLRLLHYPLDSEKHRQKKEVIRFLSKVGLDYSKTSIPNWVINWAKKEYPNSWKEYLSHY